MVGCVCMYEHKLPPPPLSLSLTLSPSHPLSHFLTPHTYNYNLNYSSYYIHSQADHRYNVHTQLEHCKYPLSFSILACLYPFLSFRPSLSIHLSVRLSILPPFSLSMAYHLAIKEIEFHCSFSLLLTSLFYP